MGVKMRTPQAYPPHTDAAHAARRVIPDPMSARLARAKTRERLGLGTSVYEDEFCRALDAVRMPYTRQKAVGPYNVDVVVGMTAIELSGGGHNPRVRRNAPARRAFLEESGYTVYVIDAARRPQWLAEALQAAGVRNPSPRT